MRNFTVRMLALGIALSTLPASTSAQAPSADQDASVNAVSPRETPDDVESGVERGSIGRLKVAVPEGWNERENTDALFSLRYIDGEGEDVPTLSLAGAFSNDGTAHVGVKRLIDIIQMGTPGFSVKSTTDIEVPGATSAVRVDFVYGTEETHGVFEGMWVVAADDKTDQSIALTLTGLEIEDALADELASSLVMLPESGTNGDTQLIRETAPDETSQTAGAPEETEGAEVLATGRYESGEIIAEVHGLTIDRDRLTVKATLRPATERQKFDSRVIYSNLGKSTYEKVFLISGDNKYMLVHDSKGQPLATPSLTAKGSGAMIGSWYGVFPKPPAGQSVTLYLTGFDPIGPFLVPAD